MLFSIKVIVKKGDGKCVAVYSLYGFVVYLYLPILIHTYQKYFPPQNCDIRNMWETLISLEVSAYGQNQQTVQINFCCCFSFFPEKKQDFLIRGRKDHEIEEKFGFAVENNVASLELIASIGLQSKDSEYNALGYNRMGVYLCKNGDICLQHALVKHSGSHVMRMVIYKV